MSLKFFRRNPADDMKRFFNYLIFLMLFFPPLIFFYGPHAKSILFSDNAFKSLTVILWISWLARGIKRTGFYPGHRWISQ